MSCTILQIIRLFCSYYSIFFFWFTESARNRFWEYRPPRDCLGIFPVYWGRWTSPRATDIWKKVCHFHLL